MGKFINTSRKDTINTLVDGFKERLKNPYYLHSDKKPTIVDYFSINQDQSTLDEGLENEYTQIKGDSPFRYNKIEDFYLYGGFDTLEVNLSNTEYGLASDNLESVTTVLPDTIVPVPGDHFSLKYMDRPGLFEVISVNIDTLESGANMYRLEYQYSKDSTKLIDKLVVETFKFIPDNSNTKLKPIIKTTAYDMAYHIEVISNNLKKYYKELFYHDKVQTFVFKEYGANFYDANMVEFLIRNNILGGEDFLYLTHQLPTHRTFGLDYTDTIFHKLENKIKSSFHIDGIGKFIDNPISILSMNKEEYFSLKHIPESMQTVESRVEIFDKTFLNNVLSASLYNQENMPKYKKFEVVKGTLEIVNRNISNSKCSVTIGPETIMPEPERFNKLEQMYCDIDILNSQFNNNKSVLNIPRQDGLMSSVCAINLINEVDNTFNVSSNISVLDNIKNNKCILTTLIKQNKFINYKCTININNEYYVDRNNIYDIIIKYFNDMEITSEDIQNIDRLHYIDTITLFYCIPMIIFILEQEILKYIKK